MAFKLQIYMIITDILGKIGYFSEEDVQLFVNKITPKQVKKGEILLNQRAICKSVYFIIEGAFIEYNFKDEIEQNIIDLYLENEWLLNKQSFVRQAPSETIIEAFSEGIVFEIDINHLLFFN